MNDTMSTTAEQESTSDLLTAAPIANAEKIIEAMDAALSPNTLLVYRQRWGAMQRHFLSRGWAFVPVRAHDDSTDDERASFIARWCSYLSDLHEQGRSLSFIQQTHAACRWGAQRAGGDPELLTDHRIRTVLRGIRKSHDGELVKQARALDLTEIRRVVRATPDTLQGKRDRALLLVGIASALRSASLADLRLNDITPVSNLGVEIRVRRTKTTKMPVVIPVRTNTEDHRLDPVDALLDYIRALRAHGANDDAHLFQRINGTNSYTGRGVTPGALSGVLRRRLDLSGVSPLGVSSHSLRSTFVTLAYRAGVPEASIQRTTLHRSTNQLRTYDRSTYWQSASADIWKD